MAKDRRKLQHIHSSIEDKQPTPQSLEVGEIAVNNAEGKEFLSIKNSNIDNPKVIRFSSDEQIITWMEKKEVMPYEGQVRGELGPDGEVDDFGSYGITNDDLLNNKSNIVIKNNQVAAGNTAKHDIVNGAVDIYDKEVNPTSDSGITDGAGFAIDMSRYAMIGANPSFSSVTVTHQSNLSGTTNISDGAGGDVLNVTTTNVNATDTNWNETITNKTSKITTLNASATTATLSGNTLDIKENDTTIESCGKISGKTNAFTIQECATGGTATINETSTNISGTNLSIQETNTDITSCGRLSANTNDFEVKQCAADGKFVVNSDDTDINGKTFDVVESASATIKTPAATISGSSLNIDESTTDITSCTRLSANTNSLTIQECTTGNGSVTINETNTKLSGNTLTIDEGTSISAKTTSTVLSSTTTDISGNTLNINEENTTIKSCTSIELQSDDLKFGQCTTGSVEFDFCNGFNVNSNAVKFEQCSTAGTFTINEKDTNISGTTLEINEKDKVEIVGGNKVHIGGETVEVACDLFDVDADSNVCVESSDNARFYGANDTEVGVSCTNQLSKNTVINSLSGTVVSSDSDTCIYGRNVNVGGDVRTRIGANCQGEVDSTYVEVSATTSITETAPIIELSSSTTNLISNATNIDAESSVCISAGTIACFYGNDTRIGMECDRTTIATATTIEGTTVGISGNTTYVSGATTLNLSGATVGISGTTLNEKFTTINVSGGTINQSGSTYNITANTTNTGDLTVTGNLYLTPDCTDKISADTVNEALCEVYDRSVITMTRVDTPSDSRLSATYKLWQNGEQIGYDIDVPKDGFLSNVELVNVSDVYYLRFTWNIYDAETHTYSTGSTDVNVEDLVKDIDDKNPSDTGTAANHNVVVDVHYDATDKKMVVSAETTPTMHVDNLYATTDISGTNITASAAIRANNVSANTISAATSMNTGTLTASGAIKGSSVSAATISAATSMNTGTLTASGAIKGSSVSANTISASTSVAAPTINVGNANISGTTTLGGGLSKGLNWQYGSVKTADSGSTVFASASTDSSRTIIIPKTTDDITNNLKSLTISTGNTYVSGSPYNGDSAAKIVVPASIDNLTNYEQTNNRIVLPHPVAISGIVTATSAVYSSDRELKENINNVSPSETNKAANIFIKSFNFKNDENKNKMYGVIAQEVQDAGLEEIVYKNEEGHLAVDYTSLMILKIAYLQEFCAMLNGKITDLENKIKNFTDNGQ